MERNSSVLLFEIQFNWIKMRRFILDPGYQNEALKTEEIVFMNEHVHTMEESLRCVYNAYRTRNDSKELFEIKISTPEFMGDGSASLITDRKSNVTSIKSNIIIVQCGLCFTYE